MHSRGRERFREANTEIQNSFGLQGNRRAFRNHFFMPRSQSDNYRERDHEIYSTRQHTHRDRSFENGRDIKLSPTLQISRWSEGARSQSDNYRERDHEIYSTRQHPSRERSVENWRDIKLSPTLQISRWSEGARSQSDNYRERDHEIYSTRQHTHRDRSFENGRDIKLSPTLQISRWSEGARSQSDNYRERDHEIYSTRQNPPRERSVEDWGDIQLSPTLQTSRWSEGARNGDRFACETNESSAGDIKNDIDYQKLQTWAEEPNAGQILLWIANESDAFADYMKGDIDPDCYRLLVKICKNILSVDHYKQALNKVLTIFITSHFFDHDLFSFVSVNTWCEGSDAKSFFDDILLLIKKIVVLLPGHAFKCNVPLSLLKNMVQDCREFGDKCVQEELLQSVINLHKKVKKDERIKTGSKVTKNKSLPHDDTETPPEDFRTLSIIPEASEILTESEPFLRAVLVKGAYRDENHYLDIQFRLIREDFVGPLRRGINEFRKNGSKRDFKTSDIRLYFNVRIIGMTTINGINHVLQFDVTSLKSVKWEHSKRFLNGSLLCLSKDNFETILFATVAFRDPINLKDGIISVEFRGELETVFSSSPYDTYVMAETTAFFESYYPILEGLKETNTNNSLQKYFIYNKRYIKPPKYLLGGVRKYNLAGLTEDGSSTQVSLLNTMSWPPAEKLNLNECQREAAQLALTKELAIIQGPPGTGKTYVGLKVMKALLENQTNMAYNDKGQHDPILVVCYTNRALDRFLKEILKFCPNSIVKVGGKKSPGLEKFNLKHLTSCVEIERNTKTALINKCREMQSISGAIKKLKFQMDIMEVNILSENVLRKHMLPEHYTSLMSKVNENFMETHYAQTKHWLNTLNSLDIDTLPERIITQSIMLVLQMPELTFGNSSQSWESIKTKSAVDRARIYQGWLHLFRSRLDKLNFEHMTLDGESNQRILSDSELSEILPVKISSYISSHQKTDVIKNWVLGLNKSLLEQLEDMESLIHFFSQNEQLDDDEFDDVDWAEESKNDSEIEIDQSEMEEIAKATLEIKHGFIFLIMKAEKLGLGNDAEIYNEYDCSWQTMNHKKSLSFSTIRHYLTNMQPMTKDEEKSLQDVWTLDIKKRFSLYNLWIQRYRDEIAKEMTGLVYEYEYAKARKKEIKMEIELNVLRESKVIGMTTTGAAKYRALLKDVGCRIIVVEEAAEVLEAHIITALNENCQHLILIGDHQQLRPKPKVYTLAKDYHLDLSLFERLIKNGFYHVTLKQQHRMRPSISKIMRHIYPCLEDHISVTKYENIRGMEKDIFFINHKELELNVNDSHSKLNFHEASFLVGLLIYLLCQGYKPSEITILATYLEQSFLLRKMLKENHIEDVFVSTVDNFQGEENDIILLSLVRSNPERSIGFLQIWNRVCVALSRAKKGLFIVGNFEILTSKSKLWEEIIKTAEDAGVYGDNLLVFCPNHPNLRNKIRYPEEFQEKCPEGGCGHACEVRLKCGHFCPLLCHGYDLGHEEIQCNKRCVKKCPEGHQCKEFCFEDCGPCSEEVEKIIPKCGHTDKVQCHKPAKDAICSKPCEKVLDCQHRCVGRCGYCLKNKEHTKCCVPVEYFWPCDHICKVPCYMKPSLYPCPKACQAILECGHKCAGSCSECEKGTSHIDCNEACSKILPCGHRCSSACGIPCPPCPKVCSIFCRHGSCGPKGHACSGECKPCHAPCPYRCIHKKCKNECHELCSLEPCQERCQKILMKCNHRCSGLCGELCVCALCHTVCDLTKEERPQIEKSEQSVVLPQNDRQLTTERKSENVQLNKTSLLIKIPSCGHVFQLSALDSYVENLPGEELCLRCPECNLIIQDCFHYNKIIKVKRLKIQQEKQRIRQINQITVDHRTGALESQRIVKSTDLKENWSTITKFNIGILKTKHEIVSFNLKAKYAYVLSDIQLLLKSREISDKTSVLNTIKAVQKLATNMTQNQIAYFQIELKRLIFSAYIYKVEVYFGLNWDAELKRKIKEVNDNLKKRRSDQRLSTKLWQILKSFVEKALQTKQFSAGSQAHSRFILTQKMLERDWNILDSEADQVIPIISKSNI